MNSMIFLVLLTISSVVTGLVTEVWKKLTTKFPTNLAALITGVFVGGGVGCLYMFFNEIAYSITNIVYIIILAIASGFAATLGFDKVSQAVKQIQNAVSENKKEGE